MKKEIMKTRMKSGEENKFDVIVDYDDDDEEEEEEEEEEIWLQVPGVCDSASGMPAA